MITWTETAREELEHHVAKVRTRMVAVGADADEVAADLERHVEAELSEAKISVATREDVRRVLTRMGAVEAGLLERSEDGSDPSKGAFSGFVTFCSFGLGVALPAAALLFEFSTRMCSSDIFDPMPTIGHVVLIALVPVANALALFEAADRRDGKKTGALPRWVGALNGAAISISAIYALMFAVLTPFAVVAIIFFGLGLLPLAPLFSFVTALICRARLRRMIAAGRAPLPGWRWGAGLALAALLALEAPSVLTEAGARMARSEDADTARRGLWLLRAVGDEDRLLLRCYAGNGGAALDIVSFVFSIGESGGGDVAAAGGRSSSDEARALFYRVTGKPFNLVPVPSRFSFGGRPRMSDGWIWDANAGGEVVGQRLKGLTLAESRLDGTIDANALTGYVEWTMVFKNAARWNQEARAQIALPEGGVVSRLTLWVNGEEREAAFAGRAQVREAYQQVAIRQNRDPVLVTTKGATGFKCSASRFQPRVKSKSGSV
jgi:hypothetical protein